MQNIRSVRGVRKEINYSEPCSNAADKNALAHAQMDTTQTQLCFILGIWAWFGIIYFLIFTLYDSSSVRELKIHTNSDEHYVV